MSKPFSRTFTPERSATATQRSCRPSSWAKKRSCCDICRDSSRPILPNPSSATAVWRPSTSGNGRIRSSWNSRCSACRARAVSSSRTASVMFSSDEPWAMATTLIRSRATAAKVRAAMPGAPRMPRPTTATSEIPFSARTVSTSRVASSGAKASRSARVAWSASVSGTTKQMLDSLDAWLIMLTEWPAWASAVNVRAATPGTPIMPLPSTETSACRGIAVSALTG
jgi:hypothetical protein